MCVADRTINDDGFGIVYRNKKDSVYFPTCHEDISTLVDYDVYLYNVTNKLSKYNFKLNGKQCKHKTLGVIKGDKDALTVFNKSIPVSALDNLVSNLEGTDIIRSDGKRKNMKLDTSRAKLVESTFINGLHINQNIISSPSSTSYNFFEYLQQPQPMPPTRPMPQNFNSVATL